MTFSRREEILSKDAITIAELGELLGIEYQMAAREMRAIKNNFDRLKILGKVHVQDYIDYYKVDMRRYVNTEAAQENKEVKQNAIGKRED